MVGVMNFLTPFLQSSSRLLVVSACTAKKNCGTLSQNSQLSEKDFDDPSRRMDGEKRLAKYCLPAAKMYTGYGHKFVREGVALLREHGFSLSHFILSAGYGLISENDMIAPYNVTFAGASKSWIQGRGEKLHLRQKLTKIAGNHDRTILILGREYFEAMGLPLPTEALPRTLAYIAPSIVNRIGRGVETIAVGNNERKRIGAYSSSAKERLFLVDTQQALQITGNL